MGMMRLQIARPWRVGHVSSEYSAGVHGMLGGAPLLAVSRSGPVLSRTCLIKVRLFSTSARIPTSGKAPDVGHPSEVIVPTKIKDIMLCSDRDVGHPPSVKRVILI